MHNNKFYLLSFIAILFLLVGMVPEHDWFDFDQLPLSNEFKGTYVCKSNAGNTIIVDPEKNVFYYLDNLNEIYFHGTFEKTPEDDSYKLSSNKSEPQIITCKDLKFHFIFDNIDLIFQKFSDAQSDIGGHIESALTSD